LGTLSIPTFSLDLNLPDGGNEPAGSTQREAYDLIADAFGPGTAGPLLVTADITQTTDILDDLAGIRAELERVDGVASVSQGIPSPGLELAIFRVAPETAPDDPATKGVVADLRAAASGIEEEFGTPLAVTGVTAVGIDISTRLTNALVPFALIVFGLSIVLLTVHGWLYVVYLACDFVLWRVAYQGARSYAFLRFLWIAMGGIVPFLSFYFERQVPREVEAIVAELDQQTTTQEAAA
ncbi:MAG: DUF3817 domain-containing protein, partial [Actinomycetes bacterium]